MSTSSNSFNNKSTIKKTPIPADNGHRMTKRNPLEKLQDNPKSLRCAINAMCYDCNGMENWARRTRECDITTCPLFNVRPFRK